VERIGLRAEAAGSRARGLEIAAESRGQEGAEDELGTPNNSQCLSWIERVGTRGGQLT
jgi:hypothetical protein